MDMIFPNPAWADVDHLNNLYLMWQPVKDIGVMVTFEGDRREARVTFCSFFDEPEAVFIRGLRLPNAEMSLELLKDIVRTIEERASAIRSAGPQE